MSDGSDFENSVWNVLVGGTNGVAAGADPGDVFQCINGGSCPTGVFPWGFIPGSFKNIQLDIVGFLAILGEATVLNNGQVAALSKTSFLPRLIPAPQALIRTSRPERLEPASGTVVGAHSGNIRRQINHIPNILHQVAFHLAKIESPETETYRVVNIKIDWSRNSDQDIKKATEQAAGHGSEPDSKRKKLTARFRSVGPLACLAYFGCAQSVAMLIYSAIEGDGMSLLATIILSLVSTLTGVANYWTLSLPERSEDREALPPSDVIVGYNNGSFLVVTCPEQIARLYFQQEQCTYWISDSWQYRGICLLATILLMLGVICLANATQDLQIAWAVMYIAINAVYWIVAALPTRLHWDMSNFVTEHLEFSWYAYGKPDEAARRNEPAEAVSGSKTSLAPTFTEALWKAIGVTGSSQWARTADLAPDTLGWDDWLQQAEEVLSKINVGDDLAIQKMSSHSPTKTHADSVVHEQDVEHGNTKTREKVTHLPDWNYRQALTSSMSQFNGKTKWSDRLKHGKR